MRIAICDDNPQWIEIEKQYLIRLSDMGFTYEIFYSGESLIQSYRENGCVFDAIFLDMEMGGLDGINTANEIRKLDRHVLIVFVTSHTKYMQDSFVCSPFRFLVKPIDFEEFRTVMQKIFKRLEDDKQSFSFYEDRNTIRLLYDEIMFFQSVKHQMLIKTSEELHRTYKTISALKQELTSHLFVQTHKSFIINISYVSKVTKDGIVLRGYNHMIPLSDTYRSSVINKIMLFEERKHLSW